MTRLIDFVQSEHLQAQYMFTREVANDLDFLLASSEVFADLRQLLWVV